MTTWWYSLDLVMKIMWGITLASTAIFVIQTVLTYIGADGIDGIDGMDGIDGGDMSLDGMSIYTFRNFVNFFLGFGWTFVLLHDELDSTFALVLISTAVGVILVALVMYMLKLLSKMQQSGNIDVLTAAVGCKGKVYLTIPASMSGPGKVQININNAVREYDAFTEGEILSNGTPIVVVAVKDALTLVVEKQ